VPTDRATADARTWNDLPRDWLLANLEMARAAELKSWVLQAVEWGFDQPEGLTNNAKRVRWLRRCRDKAWDMLASGDPVPAPGTAQPADEKPRRAPQKRKTPPATPRVKTHTIEEVDMDDTFPPSRARQPAAGRRTPTVRQNASGATAAECNAFLRSLPAFTDLKGTTNAD